jgi:hypothetical protein
MSEQYEHVDHPIHYQMPGGIEVIDIVEHMPFNVGNAVKYLCRAGRKPGTDAVTDLRKAAFYVAREIALRARVAELESDHA